MDSNAPNTENLDVEFLLDRSASMLTKDCGAGHNKTRWAAAQEITFGLATELEKVDSDGICVVPFSRDFKVYDNVTADKVAQIFADKENQPKHSTDTAGVVKNRIDAYFARKAAGGQKNLWIGVLTDGEPDDQDALAKVIAEATHKLDSPEEMVIQFMQVGYDQDATKFLKFLDEDLKAKYNAKYDIVNTMSIEDVDNFDAHDLLLSTYASTS